MNGTRTDAGWSHNSWTAERLLDAAGQLCNGTLDDGEGRELDALLRDDPVARRLYTDYMWLHASLYSESGSLGVAAMHDAGAVAEQAAVLSLTTPGRDASGDVNRRFVRPGRSMQLAAAALIGVAAASSWLTYELARSLRPQTEEIAATAPSTQPRRPIAEADPALPVVAQITGTHNCRWRRPELGIDFGSKLRIGQQLELEEGVAEITFDDGATVLLEGPAALAVDAADKLGLTSGRLAVVAPQRSGEFRVATQTLNVVDVGAEFGLWAQESGAAEVHVFNGLVKADVRDADGRTLQRLELNAAEAARVTPLSTTVVEFPADDAMFVRSILPTSGPHDGLLAYEAFRYPEGPLEAQNGGFGWAGPWFTTSADEQAGPDSNRVTAGSLTVGGMVPVGNRAQLAAQYNRIRRQLATSVGGVFDAAGLVENRDDLRLIGRDGKRVYISFLQRVSKAGDGFYGVELHRGDGNGNRVLCIGNDADDTAYGVTSNVNIYGKQNFPGLGAEPTDAALYVIKITFGVENRDLVEVYRNPESLRDEQACTVDAVLRGNFAFDRISLANFDGTKVHEADEIRVGSHFLAVTGRWGNNEGRALRQQMTRLPAPSASARPRPSIVMGWVRR